jgi:hypothetical protein
VVRAEDSRPRGRGFESRRILDGYKRFAIYYIKEKKLKLKVAKWGTPKKVKKIIVLFCFPALTPLSIAKLNCHLISSSVLVSALTIRADSFNESGKRKANETLKSGKWHTHPFCFHC